MHASLRWLTVSLLVSFSGACSARGGVSGGGNSDPDAATSPDVPPSPMDAVDPAPDTGKPTVDVGVGNDLSTPPADDGTAPVDVGAAPVDVGAAPVDVGAAPVDVGTPPRCGDGTCNGTETCGTCPGDCGPCPASCGDGTCQSSESCTNCPGDCGACPARCGDGTCNGTETCTTCPGDCGACAPRCGDGPCNGTETCTTCPGDCGICPPTPCAEITSCADCVALTRCGWCTWGGGRCESGNSVGPTVASMCPTFGRWVRSASVCPAPDAGTPDAGTVTITRSCTGVSPSTGLEADCGWLSPQTFNCSPGTGITVGCTGDNPAACTVRLGSCAGDPMIRACAEPGCTYARRLLPAASSTSNPDDDFCGTCPLARYTCPSSGQITVYTRAYTSGDAYTCTLGRG